MPAGSRGDDARTRGSAPQVDDHAIVHAQLAHDARRSREIHPPLTWRRGVDEPLPDNRVRQPIPLWLGRQVVVETHVVEEEEREIGLSLSAEREARVAPGHVLATHLQALL